MFLGCFFHKTRFLLSVSVFSCHYIFSALKATRLRHRSGNFDCEGGSFFEKRRGGKFKKHFGFPRVVPKFPRLIKYSSEHLNSLCSGDVVQHFQFLSMSNPNFDSKEACLLEFYLKTSAVVGTKRIFSQQFGCTQTDQFKRKLPWL